MMYVIAGTDINARIARRREIVKGSIEEISWEDLPISDLEMMAETSTLLGDIRAYLLTGALGDASRSEEFFSTLPAFVSSVHTFIFEEEKVLKKESELLKKAGAIVEVTTAAKKETPFNIFALASAFGSRKRKESWLLLCEALRSGIAPENIAGVLHWKVRDMLTGTRSGSYSHEELVGLSRQLVYMYHDAHRGKGELGLLLERFILTL